MTNMMPDREKGFSLIELLVALAIGLLVTLVVTQAYLGGLGTQQAQTEISRAQESSRFAFDMLTRSIRKAGYKNPKAYGIPFCPNSSLPRLTIGNDMTAITTSAFGTDATIVNSSDVIRVTYYGEEVSTTNSTVRDCLGNNIANGGTPVSDTFFIAADTSNNNEPALFCYTTNAAASGNVPLVPGVESMQMLYGEDTDGDGTINRYVPASTAVTVSNVRSIMLSLVTRTPNAKAVDNTARTFNHFGTNYDSAANSDPGSVFTAPTDRRTRQHFSTTIALRNLCPV